MKLASCWQHGDVCVRSIASALRFNRAYLRRPSCQARDSVAPTDEPKRVSRRRRLVAILLSVVLDRIGGTRKTKQSSLWRTIAIGQYSDRPAEVAAIDFSSVAISTLLLSSFVLAELGTHRKRARRQLNCCEPIIHDTQREEKSTIMVADFDSFCFNHFQLMAWPALACSRPLASLSLSLSFSCLCLVALSERQHTNKTRPAQRSSSGWPVIENLEIGRFLNSVGT